MAAINVLTWLNMALMPSAVGSLVDGCGIHCHQHHAVGSLFEGVEAGQHNFWDICGYAVIEMHCQSI